LPLPLTFVGDHPAGKEKQMKGKALVILALCTLAFPAAGIASHAQRSVHSPRFSGRTGPIIPNAENVPTPVQYGRNGPVVAGGL
jgi:hypothetical protein